MAPIMGELKTYRKNTSALTMIMISNIEKAANTPNIFVNFVKMLTILNIIILIQQKKILLYLGGLSMLGEKNSQHQFEINCEMGLCTDFILLYSTRKLLVPGYKIVPSTNSSRLVVKWVFILTFSCFIPFVNFFGIHIH